MDKNEQLIRCAFTAGELWGVTYSTWFKPSKEDTEKQIQKLLKKIHVEVDHE